MVTIVKHADIQFEYLKASGSNTGQFRGFACFRAVSLSVCLGVYDALGAEDLGCIGK